MDERPPPAAGAAPPATWPPVGRPAGQPPQRHTWRRLTRSRRGAAGLAIGSAALLLWPFAGWSPWPWLAGLAALVLLRLLRLDGLLRGWVWHVGGLVVVVGLMIMSDNPWAWGLAASIGVLLAGLAQLPWWRLAAVGAVLCAVFGVGYGISQFRTAEEVAAQQAQTQLQNRGQLGAARLDSVLPVLLNSIARGDVGPVCDSLLTDSTQAPFAASVGAPDCASAVRALSARVVDRGEYADAKAVIVQRGRDTMVVDACQLRWGGGVVLGPQVGTLTVGRIDDSRTFFVTGFRPCP
jgi:hypothetical protein